MVTEQEFPAAFYGKSATNDGSDQYKLLGRSSDFPEEALAEFEKLSVAIQWSGGGGNSPYRACYAAWPVSETGAIVARITDSGPDRLNRPHTLRVEAAWIGRDQVPDWPTSIGGLLQDGAWLSHSTDSFDVSLRLSVGHSNQNLGANVAEALKNTDTIPSILVASHKNYRASGFDIVQDPDQPNGVHREVDRNLEARRVTRSVPVGQHVSREPRKRVWLPLLLFAICLLLVVFAGWEYFSRQQLQSQYNTLVGEVAETNALLENESKNRDKLQQDLREATQELDEVRDELEQLRGERQEYALLLRDYQITSNDDLVARLEAFDRAKSDRSIFDAYTKLRLERRIQSLKRGLDETIADLERLRESVRDEELLNREE